MEEKNYEAMNLLARLKIIKEGEEEGEGSKLPIVVMLKEGTSFSRIPFLFPSQVLNDPFQLAEMIRTAILETDKLQIDKKLLDQILEESGLKDYQVFDATNLSPEELKKYTQITPQGD